MNSDNPASLPAERSVLGAMIEDESLRAEVLASGIIRAEDFFLSDHRRIFQTIEALRAQGSPVDFISVAESLGNRQDDYAIIANLAHGVLLHEEHILLHARIVRRKAQLRALLKVSEWIMKTIDETSDPGPITAEIRKMLDAS
jgi:replicative DNA helicase